MSLKLEKNFLENYVAFKEVVPKKLVGNNQILLLYDLAVLLHYDHVNPGLVSSCIELPNSNVLRRH